MILNYDDQDITILYPTVTKISNQPFAILTQSKESTCLYDPIDDYHGQDIYNNEWNSNLEIKKGESIAFIDAHNWDNNEYIINCELQYNKDAIIAIEGRHNDIGNILAIVSDTEHISACGEYVLMSQQEVDEINTFYNKSYKYIFFSYN